MSMIDDSARVEIRRGLRVAALFFIGLLGGASMMPLPTVLATLVPKKAPTRLATAAMSRAMRGVSARVDTEVAIALAESWKPLV